jgi:hypothetical protein
MEAATATMTMMRHMACAKYFLLQIFPLISVVNQRMVCNTYSP